VPASSASATGLPFPSRVSETQEEACFALTLVRCQRGEASAKIAANANESIGIRANERRSTGGVERASPAQSRRRETEERKTALQEAGSFHRSIEHGDPNGQCSGT